MNAGNDLADTGFNASLLPQICDVFPSFADDNASVFCAHESAQGEGVVGGGGRRARLRGRLWKMSENFRRRRRRCTDQARGGERIRKPLRGTVEEKGAGSEQEVFVVEEMRLDVGQNAYSHCIRFDSGMPDALFSILADGSTEIIS